MRIPRTPLPTDLLRERMIQEQLRVNEPSKDEGCFHLVNNIATEVRKLQPEKREFYDVLSLSYCWTSTYLPSTCPCGKRFDVDLAMLCMKSGFVHRRHDDVRDQFASLLRDVYYDIEVEPHLQALTGEALNSSAKSSDEARLDVSARVSGKGGNVHI